MARTARHAPAASAPKKPVIDERSEEEKETVDEETQTLEAAPLDDDSDSPVKPHEPRIAVIGRSAFGKHPDGHAYGHWRAGVHWPSSEQKEELVTVSQLDELLSDPNITLVYDKSEAHLARATIAKDSTSKEIAKKAAAKEIESKVLRARAAAMAAAEAAKEAELELAASRAKLAAL